MSSGAGEKTEQPTEKRLRDARRKGQVAKSQDLTSAVLLITAALLLVVVGEWTGARLAKNMRDSIILAASFKGSLNGPAAFSVLLSSVLTMAAALAPLFVGLVVVAVLVNYLQIGPIFAFDPVKPTINKLNPFEGFKQKFLKLRPYVELCKTIVKMVVIGTVTSLVLWDNRQDIFDLSRHQASQAASVAGSLIVRIISRVGIAFFIIAIGDLLLQRFLHRKELRMTKHEVKEEFKETEGNPLHKVARRQFHREVVTHSLLAAVKKADVVVVNPTHFAVALQYDRSSMSAPAVVAKGVDFMAAHIREIASELRVPMMRDVQLARALYRLEVDCEIPEELYEAVAVVLRWCYTINRTEGSIDSQWVTSAV